MEVLAVIFLNSLIFGPPSSWLYLGDTAEAFEKMYRIHGKIKMKGAKAQFRSMLSGAIFARYAFGLPVFLSALIYKLLTKEKFIYLKKLPDDFWDKYFEEDS